MRSKSKLFDSAINGIHAAQAEKQSGKSKNINALRIDDKIVKDRNNIIEHKKNFYQNLYKKRTAKQSRINFLTSI